MASSFDQYWHQLPFELCDQEIVRKHLGPAARQALSWTCNAYHAHWKDTTLKWVKNSTELPTTVQEQCVREFAQEQLVHWCTGMPNRGMLSMYRDSIVWQRDLKAIDECVQPMCCIQWDEKWNAIGYAFIKANRFDDFEQLQEGYLPWCYDTFFEYAGRIGHVPFLLRFGYSTTPTIVLERYLLKCTDSVEWDLLLKHDNWKKALHDLSMNHIIQLTVREVMPRVVPKVFQCQHLPGLWPHLTPEQQKELPRGFDPNTGLWMDKVHDVARFPDF